jgi:hypothetical protein
LTLAFKNNDEKAIKMILQAIENKKDLTNKNTYEYANKLPCGLKHISTGEQSIYTFGHRVR